MVRYLFIIFFAFFVLISSVQAEEFERTHCYSGTDTMFHNPKDLTAVLSWQQNGIIMSDDQRLNNMTVHCEGVQVGIGEKRKGYSVCTYKDVDGHMFVGAGPYAGIAFEGEEFLEGTGKWKGIKGVISK
jgi:hypothetical protein